MTPTNHRGAHLRAPRVLCAVVVAALAAPLAAASQTITPQRRAAIEKLLEMTGTIGQARAAAERTSAEALDILVKSRPNIPPRAIELTKEVFGAELDQFMESPDGLTAILVEIYARHFTHDEVLGLLAFFQTDLGRKLAKTTPILQKEATAATHQKFQQNVPRILEALQIRLKAEGLMPPQ